MEERRKGMRRVKKTYKGCTVYLQEKGNNEKIPGTNGNLYDITCYHCQKCGHYAAQCPGRVNSKKSETEEIHHTEDVSVRSNDESSEGLMIISICNYLAGDKSYSDNSILIDKGSTLSVFKNPKMLTSIKDSGTSTILALTNDG